MLLIKCDKLIGYKLTAHYLVDMTSSNIWGEISVPSPLTPSTLNDIERLEGYILSLKLIYKSLLFGVYCTDKCNPCAVYYELVVWPLTLKISRLFVFLSVYTFTVLRHSNIVSFVVIKIWMDRHTDKLQQCSSPLWDIKILHHVSNCDKLANIIWFIYMFIITPAT